MASLTSTPQEFCLVCTMQRLVIAFDAQDRNRNVDARRFTVMRCPLCGMGCTFPRLTADRMRVYYPQDYHEPGEENDDARVEAVTRFYRETRVAAVTRHEAPPARLLDIGSGMGLFLKTAVAAGFHAEGLERSRSAVEYSRQKWGLTVHEGSVHDRALYGQYDVVTLWHVFEHLDNPRAACTRIHELLKPGGLLVIAVPDFASMQARCERARWYHLDIPRHLFHYTPRSLGDLLSKSGFRIEEVNTAPRTRSLTGAARMIPGRSLPGEHLVQHLLYKISRRSRTTPFARTLAYVEALLGAGGTFDICARKLPQ